jgi:hypothetical protein
MTSFNYQIEPKLIKTMYKIIMDSNTKTIQDFYDQVYNIPNLFQTLVKYSVSTILLNKKGFQKFSIGTFSKNIQIGIPSCTEPTDQEISDIVNNIELQTGKKIQISITKVNELPTDKIFTSANQQFIEAFNEFKEYTKQPKFIEPVKLMTPVNKFITKYCCLCPNVPEKVYETCIYTIIEKYDGSCDIYSHVHNNVNTICEFNDNEIFNIDQQIKNIKQIIKKFEKYVHRPEKYHKLQKYIVYTKISKTNIAREQQIQVRKIASLEKKRNLMVNDKIANFNILDNYQVYQEEFETLFKNLDAIKLWCSERRQYLAEKNIFINRSDSAARKLRKQQIIINGLTIFNSTKSNYIITVNTI